MTSSTLEPNTPSVPELWSAVITTFTDDYKPRGGDWSDSTSEFFRLKEDAIHWIIDYVKEHFDENRYNDEIDPFTEEEKQSDDVIEWEDFHACSDLWTLEKLVEKYHPAEFVNTRISWTLERVKPIKAGYKKRKMDEQEEKQKKRKLEREEIEREEEEEENEKKQDILQSSLPNESNL